MARPHALESFLEQREAVKSIQAIITQWGVATQKRVEVVLHLSCTIGGASVPPDDLTAIAQVVADRIRNNFDNFLSQALTRAQADLATKRAEAKAEYDPILGGP